MLATYSVQNGKLVSGSPGHDRPNWIDLLDPTREEELAVGRLVDIRIPTRADMQKIEVSSRMYSDAGTLYMTAVVPENGATDHPTMMPVTFILARDRLVTVRYHRPGAFDAFSERASKADLKCGSALAILAGLLETTVGRLADALEHIGQDIVDIGQDIFQPSPSLIRRRDRGFQIILRRIGRKEQVISNPQDSLLTLQRMSLFLEQAVTPSASDDLQRRLHSLRRDIASLSEHASALAGKITFMLDATLGMIGLEQSNIIKIVSVAAVIFLPPTLIASIYGMNFAHMPELNWTAGYPFAVLVMILSACVPAWVVRRLGWV